MRTSIWSNGRTTGIRKLLAVRALVFSRDGLNLGCKSPIGHHASRGEEQACVATPIRATEQPDTTIDRTAAASWLARRRDLPLISGAEAFLPAGVKQVEIKRLGQPPPFDRGVFEAGPRDVR